MHRRSDTLAPGDRAPGFTLPTQRGDTWSLEEALARGPVLVAFHRGTW
jgi:peroxiredoxin